MLTTEPGTVAVAGLHLTQSFLLKSIYLKD
jgi:hypothetical protein